VKFVYTTVYRVYARENYFFVVVIDCYCRMNIQGLGRGGRPILSCHCDTGIKYFAMYLINVPFVSTYIEVVSCHGIFGIHTYHHQPINVPTAGAEAFLMDYPQVERAITHVAGPVRVGG
jgi:hypothetical protein